MKKKNCGVCNKVFTAIHKTNRFCSRYCSVRGKSGKNKRSEVTKTCLVCGDTFRRKPLKMATAKYCSNDCYTSAQKATQKGSGNHNFKDSGKMVCVGCRGAFKSYNKGRKYCSTECACKFTDSIGGMSQGYQFERDFKKILEGMGYFVVRSAGSRGVADLVAVNENETALYQVKSTTLANVRKWFSELKKELGRFLILPKNSSTTFYLVIRIKGANWRQIEVTNWTLLDYEEKLRNWLDNIKDNPIEKLKQNKYEVIVESLN